MASSVAVVLRCQVHRDAEADFGSWVSGLDFSAINSPGFVGAMIESHAAENEERAWALTYRFSTTEGRETWMTSEGYRTALAGPADLFIIPPVEERIDPGERPTATEAVVCAVPPQRGEEWAAARAEIDGAVAKFPGFSRIDHYPPSDPGDRTWTTVIAFEKGEDLTRWRESPERTRGVNRIRQIAPDVAKVLPIGFGRWFAVDATTGQSTPAWKQAMVVLAVLYVVDSLLDMTLGDYMGAGISIKGHTWVTGLGAHVPVTVFVHNVIATAILAWVLMPAITRAMQWWLRPNVSRARTIQGTVLMIAIYTAQIAAFVAIDEIYQI